MTIIASWADSKHTIIRVEDAAGIRYVPDDKDNGHRAALNKEKIAIAEWQPDLAKIQTDAMRTLNARAEALMAEFYRKYPPAVIRTWPEQLALARDVIAGRAVPGDNLLVSMATSRLHLDAARVDGAQLLAFAKKIVAHDASEKARLIQIDAIVGPAQNALASVTTVSVVGAVLEAALKALSPPNAAP
ncbi:MAG: hypothetical protein KGQ46_12625 [Hyphomicrobiales bacterium]|nr:hypothetical protein [Hyphomicrobiales bacterium]MDE2113795.1 hypothetical protein [Hyphomicrobiales bacterium]